MGIGSAPLHIVQLEGCTSVHVVREDWLTEGLFKASSGPAVERTPHSYTVTGAHGKAVIQAQCGMFVLFVNGYRRLVTYATYQAAIRAAIVLVNQGA